MIEKRKGAKGFSYRVRVEKFGHIVATRTFRRKSDAVAYEREVLSCLDRGLSAIDERAGTRPVSQWCTEWLAAYKPGAPATRKRTESLVRVWVLPHFGAMSLNSVSRLAVRTWVGKVSAERSPHTARLALGVLRQVFAYAVESGALGENPAIGVKVSGVRPGIPRALTFEQVNQLANVMESPRDSALVMFLACTGLRWGEASILRWCDIRDGSVHVWRASQLSADGSFVPGPTKTHEERMVPIPEVVLDRLVSWWLTPGRFGFESPSQHLESASIYQAWTRSKELIFPSATGTPMTKNWSTRVLKPACESACIEPPVTPHQLRDTYASLAISSGATVAAVAANLGHQSITTTLRHYTAVISDERLRVASAFDHMAGDLDR